MHNKKKAHYCTPPEILAPAGDTEALRAAIKGGADAVYLGVGKFNARQGASNFTIEELRENIEFAHSYGMRVFLALNIPLKQSEMQDAIDIVHKAYSYKIDAVILQDLGLFFLLKEHFCDLPLHASTQMTIHDLKGVEFMADAGASRVILSRELTTDQIKRIVDCTSIEIELFVHGALCYSFSGRCLFSTAITERSANRGACFQPCRRPYRLSVNGQIIDSSEVGMYPISCAELCTLSGLEDIIKTGVKSLKIEGRMKRPEYVTASALIYKRVVDSICLNDKIPGPKEMDEMKTVLSKLFYRGFTRGFVLGEKDVTQRKYSANYGAYLGKVAEISIFKEEGRLTIVPQEEIKVNDGISISTRLRTIGCRVDGILLNGEHVKKASRGEKATLCISPRTSRSVRRHDEVYVSTDPRLLESLQHMELMTTGLRIILYARMGENLSVCVHSKYHQSRVISDYVVEEAKSSPMKREQIEIALGKLGDTTFHAEEIIMDIDDNVFIPLGVLTGTRRQAVEKLSRSRIPVQNRNRPCPTLTKGSSKEKTESYPHKILLSVEVSRIDHVFTCSKAGADIIYAPITLFDEMISEDNILRTNGLKKKNVELVLITPKICQEEEMPALKEMMQKVADSGFKLACSCFGSIGLANELGVSYVAQKEFNIFNSWTVEAFRKSGACRVTLSEELNLDELQELCEATDTDITTEVMAFGRELLLITKNDLLGPLVSKDIVRDDSEVLLVDKTKGSFPVKSDNGYTLIYNSTVLNMIDDINRLCSLGVDVLRLDLSPYGKSDVKDITRNFRKALDGKQIRSKFSVNEEYDSGHYFRGVL